MKKGYKFNKLKHHHSFDGIPLYGTTTILGIISKPALIPWAIKSTINEIKKKWKANKKYTKKEINEILDGGKKESTTIKEKAGDIGTNVHEAISKWIEMGCPTDFDIEKLCKKNQQVMKMFLKFFKWTLQEEVEFLMTEKNVYSERYWYGGIVDFVCMIGGHRYIGDIKTGSGIYKEHWLQCGAYDVALYEMQGFHADGYIIINIQKDATIKVQKRQETEIFKKGFIHALELYKIMKKIK